MPQTEARLCQIPVAPVSLSCGSFTQHPLGLCRMMLQVGRARSTRQGTDDPLMPARYALGQHPALVEFQDDICAIVPSARARVVFRTVLGTPPASGRPAPGPRAPLPFQQGGLNLRSAVALAPAAYSASWADTLPALRRPALRRRRCRQAVDASERPA